MPPRNLLPPDPPARIWSEKEGCFVDQFAAGSNGPFPPEAWKEEVVSAYSKGLPTDDKARKALPLWTFLMEYFPDAFLAVANVAIAGNQQHNPGQPLHWAREKSTDQMNTAFRHMWDHGRGVKKDTDGQYHLAKAIWRLSAELQLMIEKEPR